MKNKFLSAILSILVAGNSLLTLPLNSIAADDTYGKFVFEEDSWKFTNSQLYFNVNDNYLSDSDRQILMQNLKNTEKWNVRKFDDMSFSGACYSMALLSVLACYDLINYEQYCTPTGMNTSLNALNGTGTDFLASEAQQSLINYYQRLQATDNIRQYIMQGMYNTTEEERLQMLIDSVEDGSPAVLVFTRHTEGSFFAHGLVAYGVEYGDFDHLIGVPKGYDGRILIYDSNRNTQSDNFHLYFKTEDLSWVLPTYFGSEDGGELMPVLDNVNQLNQGGLLSGTESYKYSAPFMDIFVTNALESEHSLQQIALQADGSWSTKDTSMDYCKETAPYYLDGSTNTDVNFMLPGEEQGYVFDLESSQELDTAMYYENSIQHIYASNANQTVSDPSGYVGFSGENSEYELELIFNEGYYSGNWYDIFVAGSAETASLQQTDKGYLLRADNLDNVKVKVRNDQDIAVMTFSSEEDSFLIAMEECLKIGDLDGSQTVNATDAAMILKASANLGTGNESGITSTQEYAADVNSDGKCNANDAALILRYSAAVGAGIFSGTLTEFIEVM